jgi:hypothetical protein
MHPRVAPDDEVAIVHGARPTTPNCPDDPAVRAAPAPAGGREYGGALWEGQAGPEDRAPTWGEFSRPDTSLCTPVESSGVRRSSPAWPCDLRSLGQASRVALGR